MTDASQTLAPVAKPWILGISPYVPGRASSDSGRPLIKLSANENPFGTPEAARAAFASAEDCLERYPDSGTVALRDALAAHYGVEADRIVCGTGSDEVLHMAAGCFAGPGDEIIYVKYGFSVYDIAARRVGAVPVVVEDADYGTDVDAILAAVTDRTRVVFVANPNNPTGTFVSRAEVARLHAGLRPDILLVVDQAYAEYLDPEEEDGALDLARHAPNVLVTRTFSKIYGLASARVGWGYASAAVVDAMHRIRQPFSFSIAASRAAAAALSARDFVTHSQQHNREWRRWFSGEMDALGNHGIRAVPSAANFVLVLFEGALTAERVYGALMEAGYATRWLPNQGLPHGLRITIGAEAHMRDIAARIRSLATGQDAA